MKTMEVLESYLKGHKLSSNTVRYFMQVFGSLSKYSDEFPVSGVVVDEWVAQLQLE